MISNDFSNGFVNNITNANRFNILEVVGIIDLWDETYSYNLRYQGFVGCERCHDKK